MRTSIVMPVHGNWPVVRRAVDALSKEMGGTRELIVVDDASTEPAPEELPNATVLRNDRNLGFGPSCNRGAAEARGRFLCFLNSDSLLTPGALAALEARAERERAATTAVLMDEDGTVQEAGCAIGRDGVTYPLGAGSRRDAHAWAFRREVDYGSAACLLVGRDAFTDVGGFDDLYAPGYYEDADLCLRLAERGVRTVLEPRAQVVHLQYGSGTRERARDLVRRNRGPFLTRWGDRLAMRPVVVAARPWAHRVLALRDGIAILRFLVFDDAGLAGDVARRWPGSRVTLVGAEEGDGIETAAPDDVAEWLEERRFHYTAVLGADSAVGDALRRSQPQAARSLDDRVLPPPGEEPRG